jgi:hypothetical protein
MLEPIIQIWQIQKLFPHNLAIWGVIEGKKKERKRVLCIIRTSTSFLLPRCENSPKKKHIGCPVPAWFRKPISVDLPPRSL